MAGGDQQVSRNQTVVAATSRAKPQAAGELFNQEQPVPVGHEHLVLDHRGAARRPGVDDLDLNGSGQLQDHHGEGTAG